jgi:hypothetical protein
MAHIIPIPKEFLQADGTPFRVPQRDGERNLILRKDESGSVLVGSDGSAMLEMQDASFQEILRTFLNGIFKVSDQRKARALQDKKDVNPEHDMDMEDSSFAGDVFRAMNVADTTSGISLEKAPYEWLGKMIETWGVDLYGINAAVLRDACKNGKDSGSSRPERRRERANDGEGEQNNA